MTQEIITRRILIWLCHRNGSWKKFSCGKWTHYNAPCSNGLLAYLDCKWSQSVECNSAQTPNGPSSDAEVEVHAMHTHGHTTHVHTHAHTYQIHLFISILHAYLLRGHPFMTSTRGEGVRLRWTWGRGSSPCGRPHRKLKLESTDVILSSSHAKKLASFLPKFSLRTEEKWKFFLRYKLVLYKLLKV